MLEHVKEHSHTRSGSFWANYLEYKFRKIEESYFENIFILIITLRRSSEKLENKAALATMRVRILVFSSLGCLAAAGYLQKG